MARYARKLSVVGFALAAWYGYSRGRSHWNEWAFQQQHGLGAFPDPLSLAVGLAVFVLTIGFVVLLRRLAAPGPRPQKGYRALAGPVVGCFGSLRNRRVCVRRLDNWHRNPTAPIRLLL